MFKGSSDGFGFAAFEIEVVAISYVRLNFYILIQAWAS